MNPFHLMICKIHIADQNGQMPANDMSLCLLVSCALSLACYITKHIAELLTKRKPNLDLILVLKVLPVLEEPYMMSIKCIPDL